MSYLTKLINRFFGVITPEEYKQNLIKRYKDNPYAEFYDNYQ